MNRSSTRAFALVAIVAANIDERTQCQHTSKNKLHVTNHPQLTAIILHEITRNVGTPGAGNVD